MSVVGRKTDGLKSLVLFYSSQERDQSECTNNFKRLQKKYSAEKEHYYKLIEISSRIPVQCNMVAISLNKIL